jgi:hypothetical protein
MVKQNVEQLFGGVSARNATDRVGKSGLEFFANQI